MNTFLKSDYLTEARLKNILKEIAPEYNFVHNKGVPEAVNKRRRPDFRCERNKLIIEFDGDTHYCKSQRIIVDAEKDKDYQNLGYRVVRIPYFVQLTSKVCEYVFDKRFEIEQKYPQGFNDRKATLPADYCELGITKFLADLEIYSFHKREIILSLKNKIQEKGNIDLVLPKSIQNII